MPLVRANSTMTLQRRITGDSATFGVAKYTSTMLRQKNSPPIAIEDPRQRVDEAPGRRRLRLSRGFLTTNRLARDRPHAEEQSATEAGDVLR